MAKDFDADPLPDYDSEPVFASDEGQMPDYADDSQEWQPRQEEAVPRSKASGKLASARKKLGEDQ